MSVGPISTLIIAVSVIWIMYLQFGLLLAFVTTLVMHRYEKLPIFPLLYKLYCGKLGYALRGTLHPRQPQAHCITTPFTSLPGFTIVPIPILVDNLSYLIICNETRDAAVVDPADPVRVFDEIRNYRANLKYILTTHKHWDHAGGNLELIEMLKVAGTKNLKVCGSAKDRPSGVNIFVAHGDIIPLGVAGVVEVLRAPGHTVGSIMFVVKKMLEPSSIPPQAVFTGDCIFGCGCGAMFEATKKDVCDSLRSFKELPDACYVFAGHEYTRRLVADEVQRQARNPAMRKRCEDLAKLHRHQCTMPSTLALERSTNPFLRLDLEKFESLPIKTAAEIERVIYA